MQHYHTPTPPPPALGGPRLFSSFRFVQVSSAPCPTMPFWVQIAKDIRDPTSSMIGHMPFDQLLARWAENKQSLPPQQRLQVAAECSHQLSDRSSTGHRALQHKYRVAAHVILAADPGLADQVTRVCLQWTLNLAAMRTYAVLVCPERRRHTNCASQVVTVSTVAVPACCCHDRQISSSGIAWSCMSHHLVTLSCDGQLRRQAA